MGKSIEIIRDQSSAAELRALAGSTRDGRVVRRLLALALVQEDEPREEAAQLNGMDRQTLRDWVHRYNEEGVAGLYPRAIPGGPGALTGEQMEELRTMVLNGPDPEIDGVIRWRCAGLSDAIAARWSVTLDVRSVGRLLDRLKLTRLQPRPFHPKKDDVAHNVAKPRATAHARIAGASKTLSNNRHEFVRQPPDSRRPDSPEHHAVIRHDAGAGGKIC